MSVALAHPQQQVALERRQPLVALERQQQQEHPVVLVLLLVLPVGFPLVVSSLEV